MPWVRKDDQMPIHRKVAPLTDAAYRLLDEALCWSSRNLTDGRIAASELGDISKRGRPRIAAEIVGRELWHPAGYKCDSEHCPPSGPDGWVIHDYWDYQPSRAKVLADRKAAADRQRRARESRRDSSVTNSVTNSVTVPVDNPVDSEFSARNSRVSADLPASNGVQEQPRLEDSAAGQPMSSRRDSRVSHAHPGPSRPDPTPRGGSSTSVTDDRASQDPPPLKCEQHLDDPNPPNCGACADARKARDRWQIERTARIRDAPTCRLHRGQPAHNCAPCRSEQLTREQP